MRTALRLLPGIALGCVEVAYKYFCDCPSELGGVAIIKLLKLADTNLLDFLGILDPKNGNVEQSTVRVTVLSF